MVFDVHAIFDLLLMELIEMILAYRLDYYFAEIEVWYFFFFFVREIINV